MKQPCRIVLAALLLAACPLAAESLYEQSLARFLASHFASPQISYLLLDARTHELLAADWNRAGARVPAGSLLKPFTALAYGEEHGFHYPTFVCHGSRDGCWLPRGHGRVGLAEAIGYSCNAYFLRLARTLRPEDVARVAARFGLPSPAQPMTPREMIGLGRAWEVPPQDLLRAYLRLAAAPRPAGAAIVLAGMSLSARAGTARAAQDYLRGPNILAKTGTAPCVHGGAGTGDGYVIMLYPADQPRLALLVRVHGVPGARAAGVAGQLLKIAIDGE
jgi:cell division protein FtsI/penicillin-binding protein 2